MKDIYFYIKDVKHQNYLVAGDTYNGSIYHQGDKNRDNAKWKFELVESSPMDDPNVTYYRICDLKHKKYLVAGDRYDGSVYHENHNGRKNSLWAITPSKTYSGHGGFKITDALHGKCLAAGNRLDGSIYHQDDDVYVGPEKRWIIEFVNPPTSAEEYPDFYVIPSKCVVEKVEIINELDDIEQPDTVFSTFLKNNSSVDQSITFSKEITKTSEDRITTSNSCSLEVAVGISANLSFPFDLGDAGISMETTTSNTRENSKSFSSIDTTTYSVNTNVNVPPKSIMKASVILKRRMKCVNFKAETSYYFADGKSHKKIITGKWNGIMVTDCKMEYDEEKIKE